MEILEQRSSSRALFEVLQWKSYRSRARVIPRDVLANGDTVEPLFSALSEPLYVYWGWETVWFHA